MPGMSCRRFKQLGDASKITLPIGVCLIKRGQIPRIFDGNLLSGGNFSSGT